MSNGGLGTLEFAAILNGDDTTKIEEILRSFVRQVRNERSQALSNRSDTHRSEFNSDAESSSTQSYSEVSKNEHRKKKRKVEAWKQDVKAYNVPFVGTSIHKGDTGHVECGCWPTGFLEAYLEKSPLASELLGADFQRVLSSKAGKPLQTAFVRSVAELLTSAIPVEKLTSFEETSKLASFDRTNLVQNSVVSSRMRIVSIVMKEHVKTFFDILNEHAFSGSNQRLIIGALECLQYLAKSSVGTAREVTRGIDKVMKDTTLKHLATYSILDKTKAAMEVVEGEFDEGANNRKLSKQTKLALKVRQSYLDLASSLLEYGDQSIISYITSPGGKDGALKTGIAYLGLRSALKQCKDFIKQGRGASETEKDGWSSALYKFMYLIKLLIGSGHGEEVNANNQPGFKRGEVILSNKAKIEFMKGSVIEDIIYSSHFSHSENVVHNRDFQKVQSLCGDIVKILLSDVSQSPLLQELHSIGASPIVRTLVNRAIHKLLDACQTYETRLFVSSIFQNSPMLFTNWLRTMSIPDPVPTYSYLSKISLISFTLKMGPTTDLFHEKELVDEDEKKYCERIIGSIIPRALTKNIFTKGIQSTNSLLVMEMLKLLSVILCRCRTIIRAIAEDEKRLLVVEKIVNGKLPDLQVILGARTKFEQQILVTMAICDVIRLYACECPQVFKNIQFDWLKLFPTSASSFDAVPAWLQNRILTTISTVHTCYEVVGYQSSSLTSSKFYNKLISILVETKNDAIFEVTRDLVRNILFSIVNFDRVEEGICQESVAYEISLWIDGINRNTAITFGELLDTVQSVTIQHFTAVNYVWKSFYRSEEVPPITFSPLLSLSLLELKSTENKIPEEFRVLVQEISTKLLMVMPEQRLLACLVMSVNKLKGGNTVLPLQNELYAYSASILDNQSNQIRDNELAIARKAFGKNHYHSLLPHIVVSGTMSRKSATAAPQEISLYPFVDTTRSFVFFQSMKHMCQECKVEVGKVLTACFPYILFNFDSSWVAAIATNQICNLYQSSHKCVYMWLFTTFFSGNACTTSQNIIYKEVMKHLGEKAEEHLAIICASGIRKYLCVQSLSAVTRMLCHKCLNLPDKPDKSDVNGMLYIVLLHKIIESSTSHPLYFSYLTSNDVEALFTLWLSISKQQIVKRDSKAEVSLQIQLEKFLARILGCPDNHGTQSATIFKCICEYGVQDFLEFSFKDMVKTECLSDMRLKQMPFGQGILYSLITYDVALFAPISMVLLLSKVNHSDTYTSENELLVFIIHRVLEYNELVTGCNRISVERVLVDRLCIIVKPMIQNTVLNEYSQLAFDVLGKLCNQGLVNASTVEMFCELIATTVKSWRLPKQKETFHENIVNPFIRCLSTFFINDPDNTHFHSLRNVTLTHVVTLLPRILKTESFRNTICSSTFSLITALLEIGDIRRITCLKEIFLLCLKFGIDHVDGVHSPICLQTCRALLVDLSSTDTGILLFTVDKVHNMVMAHSNFDNVANQRCETRKEIIRLLVTCASRIDGQVVLDGDKVAKLFQGYHASLSEDDRLLRRLLLLYEHKDRFELNPPFLMHCFVWDHNIENVRNPEENDSELFGSDYGKCWENLIQKIDMKRVHKTISDFPWWDSVEISTSLDLEPSISITDENGNSGDDSNSESESATESEGSEADFFPTKSHENRSMRNLTRNEMKIEDDRYSPGFLLPLILGALDAFGDLAESEEVDDDVRAIQNEKGVRQQKRHIGDKLKKDEYLANPVRETFARIALRLSQKGVVSLSIACLTSYCPKLRSIALAVIYRFLQAVKSKEAQNIGAWKSRSQIEMAINAIQRGLVLSRVNAQQKQDGRRSQRFYPPRIPNICTLYLARTLFILTKPSDNMYPAVNKSFLRHKDNHGAFTNWYSIPIFMTLFCSVSDSVEQSRKERLWALNLLNDGMADTLSFRLLSRRHIPELLMTAFDAATSRGSTVQDDAECILLLKSITTLVRRGGKASFNHYFYSVGVLAWVQSAMASFALNAQHHSPDILAHFIQLIETVIRKAAYDFPDDFRKSNIWRRIDAIGIGKGISDLYLKWYNTRKSDRATYTDTSILSSVCNIFWSILKLNDTHDISFSSCNFNNLNFNSYDLNPHGVLLESCIIIVKQTAMILPDYQIQTLAAMSSLPIADQSDMDQAANFCIESINILLLGNLHNPPDLQLSHYATILHRISALSTYFKKEDEYVTLVEKLFGCRHILVNQRGLGSHW
eukprot:CAMPEP_0176479812 /NCGR_PEP_ID=MMETSP0200_2-20121128/1943_1 /TAXON_ID=947934 /ORGANISM="Chaetoceros sp., Strain GSL56" /LENGTH=2220 /DNA_ID=CAMNT_0017875889 /DNA_START=96 /DNA_END=6755 /DNA_ORIENTATION=-